MDEETYVQIISDKTASLLSTCCEIGAASASENPETHRLLREYGENVGLAFQIRDDVLDYVGRRSITGKPTGLDLSEKKLTLPLICALSRAPKKEKHEIISMVKNGGKKIKVNDVVTFVQRYGGIEYAESKATQFASRAKATLSLFPASPSKDSLMAFADFVIEREK